MLMISNLTDGSTYSVTGRMYLQLTSNNRAYFVRDKAKMMAGLVPITKPTSTSGTSQSSVYQVGLFIDRTE